MTNHKLHIAFILISLFVFSGCKKYSKDVTTVKIKAHLPHNGTPIPGIKWKIIETKMEGYFQDSKETGREFEGVTNSLGEVNFEFNPRKNTDYQYSIYFDYSNLDLPTGTYVKTQGPEWTPIYDQVNYYEIRMLPKMDVYLSYFNEDCYDSFDSFSFRVNNFDETPNTDILQQPWGTPPAMQGCANYQYTSNRLAGHYVYQWEATRNGITETGIDTFYVAPGVNNVINMHW